MIFVYFFYAYFFAGIVIAAWFSFYKITKIDAAAKGTSFWFKLIILPAGILLWPIILFKLKAKI
jgi:hypothetical protein